MIGWSEILIVILILLLLFGAQKLPEFKKASKGKEEREERGETEEETEEEEEKDSEGKVKCPVCGKEFDSERGMKIHKGKAH